MTKSSRVRCPQCTSLHVHKRGLRNGKPRFHCNRCDRNFTGSHSDISARNRFVWFRQWVEYGHMIEYISRRSGYSPRTIKNYFYNYPTWHIRHAEKVNLLIDGTYSPTRFVWCYIKTITLKRRNFTGSPTGSGWMR